MVKPTIKLFVFIAAALLVQPALSEEDYSDPRDEEMPVRVAPIRQGDAPPAPAFLPQAPDIAASQIFQPDSVDPATVRASMKARAEHDALNRKIMARQQQLYEENRKIKELQSEMRKLQKRIDEIFEADEELKQLKEKLDSVSPRMPFGIDRQEPRPDHLAPPSRMDEED